MRDRRRADQEHKSREHEGLNEDASKARHGYDSREFHSAHDSSLGDDDGFCEIAHGLHGFATHGITTGFVVHTGRVPNALAVTGDAFDALWDLHPPHQPVDELQQKRLIAPRWEGQWMPRPTWAGSTRNLLNKND